MAIRSGRLGHRYLLVAVAIVVSILAACGPALADDTATPPAAGHVEVQADTTALARAAIVDGRLLDAQQLLAKAIASADEGKRAPAIELRAVVDRWVATGAAPAARAATDPAPAPSAPNADVDVLAEGGGAAPSEAWEEAYATARARLGSGDFESAAARFSVLLRSAPSEAQSARAYVLAALSSELVGKRLVLRIAPRVARVAGPPWPREAGTHSRWYGWEIFMSDGISLLALPTLSASTTDRPSATFALLAAGGYFFASPVVHFAHGRGGVGVGSFGLRVGMPVLGAIVGGSVRDRPCRELCGLGSAALLGGAIGMLGAVVIDATALSYEQVDDERHLSRRGTAEDTPAKKSFAFSPMFAPRKEGGFDVGLGGAF